MISKEIGSIVISSQRGTFFATDKDRNPIENSIVWSDSHAIKEIKWIGDTIGAEHYHEISGAAMTSLWAYAKYKWVHDNKPALYDKAWKFVNSQEWLLHQPNSDELFTNPSSLALNGIMDVKTDVKTLDWSDKLLDAIGVSRDKLPPIKEPTRQVGVVSKITSN
ncbi:FGGY family carbohydrate kinase [Pseudoramibacter sp. HA2172]|uniref:FGGY family carbohydrate kinase n=1 Tax=Pseudoramibacter faecis TaxID=3108534 RepID=UPI002E760B76|nr:FGGY family carbohydrate kinase [Pseudoramibacter sp. HA2172]